MSEPEYIICEPNMENVNAFLARMREENESAEDLVIMDTDMSLSDFLSRVPLDPNNPPSEDDPATICLPCRLYIDVSDMNDLKAFIKKFHEFREEWIGDEYDGLGNAAIELGYFNLIARDIDDENHPITLHGEMIGG